MWTLYKDFMGTLSMKHLKKVGQGALSFTFILGGIQSVEYYYNVYKDYRQLEEIKKIELEQYEIDYYNKKAENAGTHIEQVDMKKMKYKEMEIISDRAGIQARDKVRNKYFRDINRD